jgi:hypothetical protein
MARASRPLGPLDLALERLRVHRLPYRWSESDLKVWLATCPSCGAGGWELRIREGLRGGPITLICASGCSDADVRAALEREPVHPRIEAAELSAQEALDLADQARDIAARALNLQAAA